MYPLKLTYYSHVFQLTPYRLTIVSDSIVLSCILPIIL